MKDILVYDLTNGGDEVSAYLKSAGGTLITDTGGALNVYNAALVGLSKAEDAAHVSGDQGIMALVVRKDSGGALAGTDGDYSPLQVDANGNLRIAGSFSSGSEKAEDSAHSSADVGSYSLSVRQDSPASSSSADGDYQSFKTDVLGRLWVNGAGQAFGHDAVSIASTATQITAAPLASRKKIMILNAGSRAVFVGDASVTDVNGFRISAGSKEIFDLGPAADLYAITSSGTCDVRFFEE